MHRKITLLTQHYYRANGQLPTSTAAYLIKPDPTLVAVAVIAFGTPILAFMRRK